MKYGNRSQSVAHIVGPWSWTKDERVVLLEEKNAFVAVEEEEGQWALYYDRDGDELSAVLEEQGKLDCAFVPVTLVRVLAEEPPAPNPSQSQGQAKNASGSGGGGNKS